MTWVHLFILDDIGTKCKCFLKVWVQRSSLVLQKLFFQECLCVYSSTAPLEPYPKSQLQGEPCKENCQSLHKLLSGPAQMCSLWLKVWGLLSLMSIKISGCFCLGTPRAHSPFNFGAFSVPPAKQRPKKWISCTQMWALKTERMRCHLQRHPEQGQLVLHQLNPLWPIYR